MLFLLLIISFPCLWHESFYCLISGELQNTEPFCFCLWSFMPTFCNCKSVIVPWKAILESDDFTLLCVIIWTLPLPFHIVHTWSPHPRQVPHTLRGMLDSLGESSDGFQTYLNRQLFNGLVQSSFFITLFWFLGRWLNCSDHSHWSESFFRLLLLVGPNKYDFCVMVPEAFWPAVYAWRFGLGHIRKNFC